MSLHDSITMRKSSSALDAPHSNGQHLPLAQPMFHTHAKVGHAAPAFTMATPPVGRAKGWLARALRRMRTPVALAATLAFAMLAGGLPEVSACPGRLAADRRHAHGGERQPRRPDRRARQRRPGVLHRRNRGRRGDTLPQPAHRCRRQQPPNGGLGFLSDVSGSTIVYTHQTSAGRSIFMFDTATAGAPVELDPQPGSLRERPAIGNRTVVWVDFGFHGSTAPPELVVYDLDT